MKKALLLPLIGMIGLSLGLAACDGSPVGHRDVATATSPGTKANAYLPPSANNAGTGSSDMNTPLSVVGGQVPDSSNPTPPGLPAASAALR